MTFSPEVYERIREGCQRSAAALVPFVYDLVRPASVVDVGGGEGWWARSFRMAGAQRALVLDDSAPLATEPESVRVHDGVEFAWFNAVRHAHWSLEEKFDLAVCLETGEHVPEDTADYLVSFVTAAAPVVLWSAAIPGQGGHGHVNEQWPEYWASLFRARGYACADLRNRFWDDETIEPWYRQNLLLFANLDQITRDPERFYNLITTKWESAPIRGLVHPRIYEWRISERDELAARSAGARNR